jgi:hypothetical protein
MAPPLVGYGPREVLAPRDYRDGAPAAALWFIARRCCLRVPALAGEGDSGARASREVTFPDDREAAAAARYVARNARTALWPAGISLRWLSLSP